MVLAQQAVSLPDNRQWYAIFTRSRSEKKVFEIFKKDEVEAYLPLVTSIRQWSDRKKKVQIPLLPSYVFVKTTPDNFSDLLLVPGAVCTVKHLRKHAVIQDFEIENLKILANDAENIKQVSFQNFQKGTPVKVAQGPFKGLYAECLELKGKHRILVRTEALGVTVEVNIPLSFVEKKHTVETAKMAV